MADEEAVAPQAGVDEEVGTPPVDDTEPAAGTLDKTSQNDEDENKNDVEDAGTPRKRQLQKDDDDDGESGLFDGGESSKPSKKSRKRAETLEEEEDAPADERPTDPESEQRRRREELARRITAAAKGPRRPKKKKADETDLDQMADDEVNRMREMMMAAAHEDQLANEARIPATNKLRLLKEAVETLQKTGYQQAILDNNLLEAVKMWLEPLPDKSLPSLNIQRALFPLLESMYIDTTSLKMSGLGKLMLFYTKKKGVDKNIQRTADRLIETWSRPILKRSSSYRDRQQAIREYAAAASQQHRMTAAQAQRLAAESASQATRRSRIPESVTGNAFRFAPASQVTDTMDDTQLSKLAERQRINKFKRSMQAAKR